MIIAKNLTKKFDDFLAVDQVSFEVKAGEVMVLLGPNGAGKTTTVRMLTSLIRPTEGEAFIDGHSVSEDADFVRKRVGVLTEHHGLYKRMNALNYLEFFSQLYGLSKNEYEPRIKDLLKQFGLYDVRKKRLGEYSKGMRQKLALSRAMVHRPAVLLLDEPTSAMDPASARMVRDAIHKLRSEERAVILCTHNLAEAEELADRIAIIHQGRIRYNASLEELKTRMVGKPQVMAQYTKLPENWQIPEIPGAAFIRQLDHTLTFELDHPETQAPKLLEELISQGVKIKEFSPVQRSLEQAYLEVVQQSTQEEAV
jgi:ABC-2 type transport system ATP-binding protein